ncbi:MAG: glutamate racemase [Spirochaetaceae bacterium]
MDKPIVFYDSGIGGIPYLTYLRDQIPYEDFIYVADNNNFPYGDKPEEVILEIITNIIKRIVKTFSPKVIVIACNTATVTALDVLRTIIDIPLVGVVPAIKTAASVTKNNKIGILATNRTVNGSYLKQLIDNFSSDKEVFLVGASELVQFVEDKYYNSSTKNIDRFISKSVSKLKIYDVDSVVLGCTHFIHVAIEINKALGKNVNIIDSREGVSNQVLRVITSKKNKNNSGSSHFYLTKEIDLCKNYRSLCMKSKLKYIGEIKVC